MNKNILSDILLKSEFKSLAGNRYIHITTLFLIYLFSIFCIGTSEGVLDYLEDKMGDSYVNMVDAVRNKAFVTQESLKFLETDTTIKNDFSLIGYNTFTIDHLYFNNDGLLNSSQNNPTNNTELKTLKVGVIESEEHPLWSMIVKKSEDLKPDNNSVQTIKYSGEETSVYLTESAYSNVFGEDTDFSDIKISWFNGKSNDSKKTSLPIGGVVKQLPFRLDAILFKDCYQWLKSAGNNGWGDQVVPYYYLEDPSELDALSAEKILRLDVDTIFHNDFPLIKGGTNSDKAIFTSLKRIEIPLIRGSNFNVNDEYLCFSFDDLDNVESFNQFLKNEYERYSPGGEKGVIEIDLTKIETKKYLKLFNRFGKALAFALMLVSVILIINYSLAILTQHIAKNKRNLGTLIAFGFKNNKIVLFYLLISFLLITGSFLGAYLVNLFLSDSILQGLFQSNILDISIGVGEINYVIPDLLDCVIGFLIIPLLIIYFQIRKLLKTSPGDLIYNR